MIPGFIKKTSKTPPRDIKVSNRRMKIEEKTKPTYSISLDDFLKEEGILEETRTLALEETWQIQLAMKKEEIN